MKVIPAQDLSQGTFKVLILVHPDCLSEQYQFTPQQSEEYLQKLEKHLPLFDYVIVMRMGRVDEGSISSKEEVQEHFKKLKGILSRHADLQIIDNDLGMTSLNKEIGNFLLENPNSIIYLSGGYQDLCLREVAGNLVYELGDFIKELNIRVRIFLPLVFHSCKGLGFREVKESLPWWDTDWSEQYERDQRSSNPKYRYWASESPRPGETERGDWWEGPMETIGFRRLRQVLSYLRRVLAYNLAEVLFEKRDKFERKIGEVLGPTFLDTVSERRLSDIITFEEFEKFDNILSEVLGIPSAKDILLGERIELRKQYLPSIIEVLESLYPWNEKMIERYKIEEFKLRKQDKPFTYRNYAEFLLNLKRRGNPRLLKNFYLRLKEEIEKSERPPELEEGIILEEREEEFKPVDSRFDIRNTVKEGVLYYIEMPEIQRRWKEVAERNVETALRQRKSSEQIIRGLKELLTTFKRQYPNAVYERSITPERYFEARKFVERCVFAQHSFERGDKVKYRGLYGVILEKEKSKERESIYKVLIVGPNLPLILGEESSWVLSLCESTLQPFMFEPNDKEKREIEEKLFQSQRVRSYIMPREPIKRNYDYEGNYLDRLKKLRRKRERKAILEILRKKL